MKQTRFISLVNFMPLRNFFFSVFLFFFFQRNKRGREREQWRLVPLTVVLPCDWWKPVARLMSVFKSFLLPLLCSDRLNRSGGLLPLVEHPHSFFAVPSRLTAAATALRHICAEFTPGTASSLCFLILLTFITPFIGLRLLLTLLHTHKGETTVLVSIWESSCHLLFTEVWWTNSWQLFWS